MKIAVFTKNLSNPAYAAARLGAERAAKLFGDEVLHFVPQRADDPQEQSALIGQALALAPDAIALSPVHATLVDPAIRLIGAARIPLFAFVNPVDAAPCVSYVGADDARLACEIAGYLFTRLGRQANVLMVTGHVHSVTSRDRVRGFEQAAQRHPGITFVGRCVGNYERMTARDTVAQWLADNPGAPLDACLVANDIMAMGVLEALREAGRRVPVVGVNAIPEAVAAIRDGAMLATADFNAMKMGYLAAECAARHLRGEAVPRRIELPVQIVDGGNCGQWDIPYEQRPVTTLEEIRRWTH